MYDLTRRLILRECIVWYVDVQFCPGYCVYSLFGPRAHLWRVSKLGLEPCPFYFIKSLSRVILVIYLVFISCIYWLFVILCRYCYVSFLNVVRIFRYHVFDCSYLQLFFVLNHISFCFVLVFIRTLNVVKC